MATFDAEFVRHSNNPAELVRATIVEFGDRLSVALHFGVQESTVTRWQYRPAGRDIREEMQAYLPGQETRVHVQGSNAEAREINPIRHRDFYITLNREDGIKYHDLLANGRTEAARVFLLAAEHRDWDGVPSLAGSDWYDEWEDLYDDPDFEYDYDYILE